MCQNSFLPLRISLFTSLFSETLLEDGVAPRPLLIRLPARSAAAQGAALAHAVHKPLPSTSRRGSIQEGKSNQQLPRVHELVIPGSSRIKVENDLPCVPEPTVSDEILAPAASKGSSPHLHMRLSSPEEVMLMVMPTTTEEEDDINLQERQLLVCSLSRV